MRILAIDYGTTRIGLALSDPTGTLARPLPFLPAKADGKLARDIADLVKKQADIHLLILGLPRNMDGSSGEAAVKVQAFAEILKQAITIPLKLIDERLSTVQASRQLQEAGKNTRKQRGQIDSEAACVLLQGYLDSQQSFPLLPDPDA
jgi:putative Holliday junction resolvase